MNNLTIVVFVALIAAYVILSYFQLKKLKGKVDQVLKGKLENRPLFIFVGFALNGIARAIVIRKLSN